MVNGQNLNSTLSAVCGATTLATKQYHAVSLGSDGLGGVNMVISTAAVGCTGILQDNPIVGQVGTIQTRGLTPAAIKANSAAITAGDLLEVSDDGLATLMQVSSGVPVAQAMQSITPGTAIGLIQVRLLPSNAALA